MTILKQIHIVSKLAIASLMFFSFSIDGALNKWVAHNQNLIDDREVSGNYIPLCEIEIILDARNNPLLCCEENNTFAAKGLHKISTTEPLHTKKPTSYPNGAVLVKMMNIFP